MIKRVTKDIAKHITTRPEWLTKDRDWQIFQDYRDSSQSAQELGELYGLGRAQIQNILNKILRRASLPGGLSVRALGVLKNMGLSENSTCEDFDRVALLPGSLDRCLEVQKHCGPKTRAEILSFVETLREQTTQPN